MCGKRSKQPNDWSKVALTNKKSQFNKAICLNLGVSAYVYGS